MADQPDAQLESTPTPARRPRVRKRPRTPQEAKQWRRRMASYALAGVAFIMVVNTLVGENGYLATLRAGREAAEIEAQLRQVREQNLQMKERIQRLRSDPHELEDAARKELHMSKPGETTIIIKDAPAAKSPQAPGK